MDRLTGETKRTVLKLLVALVYSSLSRTVPAQVSSVSNTIAPRAYIVVAHEDDWQLFMGDVVAETLKAGTPTTFIYLTAGDDGRDSSYWQTRERAALASTLVAERSAVAADSIKCEALTMNSHIIRKCASGKTNSYFLRLPDGKRNGAGFARYDYQSLRRLRSKKIGSVKAVDGSTVYEGWNDLVSTVSSLIDTTSVNQNLVHTMDPSIGVNPHDHFDHRMAGLLVADLRKQHAFNVRYYVGYALSTRAANRSNAQAREKTAVFRAYDQAMMRSNEDWSAYREHPVFYSECMLRTYARSPRAR